MVRIDPAGADWVHFDVMGGAFRSYPHDRPPIVEALRKVTSLPLDVHLMITTPDFFIQEFLSVVAHAFTVQAKICSHLHSTIQNLDEHK